VTHAVWRNPSIDTHIYIYIYMSMYVYAPLAAMLLGASAGST